MEILFVCTGNTCRSPMAEVLFRSKAAGQGLAAGIKAASAGLAALENSPATVNACRAVEMLGLSLQDHKARQLSRAMIEAADLILTMTVPHRAAIVQALPAARAKVFTLQEYAGTTGEIADPYGGDLSRYQLCLTDLQANIDIIWKKIRQMEAGK